MHAGDCLAPELTLLDVVYMYKWNEDAPLKFLYTVLAPPSVPARKRGKPVYAPVRHKTASETSATKLKESVPTCQVNSPSYSSSGSIVEAVNAAAAAAAAAKSKSLSPIPAKSTTSPGKISDTNKTSEPSPVEKTVPSITLKIEKPFNSNDPKNGGGKVFKRKSDDMLLNGDHYIPRASVVNNKNTDSTYSEPPKKKTKNEPVCKLKTNDECNSNINNNPGDVKSMDAKTSAEVNSKFSSSVNGDLPVYIKKECGEYAKTCRGSAADTEDMDCDSVNNQTIDSLDSSRDDGEGRMVIDETRNSDEEDDYSRASPNSNNKSPSPRITSTSDTLDSTTNSDTINKYNKTSVAGAQVSTENKENTQSNDNGAKISSPISSVPSSSSLAAVADLASTTSSMKRVNTTSSGKLLITSSGGKLLNTAPSEKAVSTASSPMIAAPSVPMVTIPRLLPQVTSSIKKSPPSHNHSSLGTKKLAAIVDSLASSKTSLQSQTTTNQNTNSKPINLNSMSDSPKLSPLSTSSPKSSTPTSPTPTKLTVPPLRISKSPQHGTDSKSSATNAVLKPKLSVSGPSKSPKKVGATLNSLVGKLSNLMNNNANNINPTQSSPSSVNNKVPNINAFASISNLNFNKIPSTVLASTIQSSSPSNIVSQSVSYSSSNVLESGVALPNCITSFAARAPSMTITTLPSPVSSASTTANTTSNPAATSPLANQSSQAAFAAALAANVKMHQKALQQYQHQQETQKLQIQMAVAAQAKQQQLQGSSSHLSTAISNLASSAAVRSPTVVSTPNSVSNNMMRSPFNVGFPFNQRPPFIAPTKPRLGRPPNPNKAQNARGRGGRGGARGGRGRRGAGGNVAPSVASAMVNGNSTVIRPNLPNTVAGLQQAMQQHQALHQQQQVAALHQQQQVAALQQQQQQQQAAAAMQMQQRNQAAAVVAAAAQLPANVQQQLALQSPHALASLAAAMPNPNVLNGAAGGLDIASFMQMQADIQAVRSLINLNQSFMQQSQEVQSPPMDLSPSTKSACSPLNLLRGGQVPLSPNPHSALSSPQYSVMSPNPYAVLGSVVSSPTTAQFNRSSSISPAEAGNSPAATPRSSASAPQNAPSPRPARSPAPASPSVPSSNTASSICCQTPEVTITKLPAISSAATTAAATAASATKTTANTISITKRHHGISITATTNSSNESRSSSNTKNSSASTKQTSGSSSAPTSKSKSNGSTVTVSCKPSKTHSTKHNIGNGSQTAINNNNNHTPSKQHSNSNNNSNNNGKSPSLKSDSNRKDGLKKFNLNTGNSNNSGDSDVIGVMGRNISIGVSSLGESSNSPIKDTSPLSTTSSILQIQNLTRSLPPASIASVTAVAGGVCKF